MKKNDTLGPWVLERQLGSGGNAVVWMARDPNGALAAIKVLQPRQPDSRERLAHELEAMKSLVGTPGVMPVIDDHLAHDDPRPWFAMPVMTPANRLALSPSEAIAACAAVAKTLATVAQLGTFHRDLKPSNLFWSGESWIVGDWGLVSFEGKESVTVSGHRLGSAYYMAPEMRRNAKTALAGPADIWSLAKTLSVLLTQFDLPPEGPHRTDDPDEAVIHTVPHPRAYLLDRILERMTEKDPSTRIPMAEVAEELAAWLELPSLVPSRAISPGLSKQYWSLAGTQAVRDFGRAWRDEPVAYSKDVLTWCGWQLQPIAEDMCQSFSCQGVPMDSDELWNLVLFRLAHGNQPKERFSGAKLVEIESASPVRLCIGFGVRTRDDLRTEMVAAIWLWKRDRTIEQLGLQMEEVSTGLAREEAARHRLLRWLNSSYAAAIEPFVAELAGFAASDDPK